MVLQRIILYYSANVDNVHKHLNVTLRTMAGKRRDPAVTAFSSEPLVTALNSCVTSQNQFDVRYYGCSLDIYCF